MPVTTGRGTTQVKLESGQFLFGRHSAARELKHKASTTYKRMLKLEKSRNVTIQNHTHYSIVTICHWHDYQSRANGEVAGKVTPKEQPSSTNNNVDNVNNEEEGPTHGGFEKPKQKHPGLLDHITAIITQWKDRTGKPLFFPTQNEIDRQLVAKGYPYAAVLALTPDDIDVGHDRFMARVAKYTGAGNMPRWGMWYLGDIIEERLHTKEDRAAAKDKAQEHIDAEKNKLAQELAKTLGDADERGEVDKAYDRLTPEEKRKVWNIFKKAHPQLPEQLIREPGVKAWWWAKRKEKEDG